MGARGLLSRRSRGAAAFLVLLGFALALVAAFLIWTAAERAAFQERVERIRRAGEPVYPTDLARPPVPDEQNAAKLLEEAAAWLKRRQEQEDGDDSMLWASEARRTEWTRGDWNRVHAYLRSVAPYFELIEQIPSRPRWHVDLQRRGVEMVDPSFPWTMDAVDYIHARVRLDRGQWQRTERAAQAVILLLDIADRHRMPFVLGHLVNTTIRDRAVQLVRLASARPDFDAALFRRLVDARLAKTIPAAGPPADVFREERALSLWYVRAWLAGDSVTLKDRMQRFPLCRPLLYRDATRMLDFYDRVLAACPTAPERAREVAERLRLPTRGVGLLNLAEPLYVVHYKLFEQYTRDTAIRRLARVVMALLEYRQVQGEWPRDLAVLGKMPTDPYSGAPFVYTRTEKGARIRAACPDEQGVGLTLERWNLAWSFEK